MGEVLPQEAEARDRTGANQQEASGGFSNMLL